MNPWSLFRCALRRVVVVCLAALCASACSDDSAADESPVDAMLDAFVAARCDTIFRCGDDPQLENAARCRSLIRATVRRDNELLLASLASGRTRLDDAGFQSCLAHMQRSCELPRDFLDVICRPAFHGTIPAGQACLTSWECEGDSTCGGSSDPCARTCRRRGAPGSACGDIGVEGCALGSPSNDVTCYFTGRVSGEGAECLEVEQRTPARADEACGMRVDIDRLGHAVNTECAPGLHCHGSSVDSPRCVPDIPVGAPCGGGERCAGGALCNSTGGSAGPTCQLLPAVRNRAGETCDSDRGVQCNPYEHLTCEGHVCVSLGDGNAGSRCRFYGSPTQSPFCNEGLYCDGWASTCRPRKPDGAMCMDGDECRSSWCHRGVCASSC